MTYGKEEDASEFYNGLIQFLVDKNADRYEQCMRTSDWAALGNSSFPTFCILSCTSLYIRKRPLYTDFYTLIYSVKSEIMDNLSVECTEEG